MECDLVLLILLRSCITAAMAPSSCLQLLASSFEAYKQAVYKSKGQSLAWHCASTQSTRSRTTDWKGVERYSRSNTRDTESSCSRRHAASPIVAPATKSPTMSCKVKSNIPCHYAMPLSTSATAVSSVGPTPHHTHLIRLYNVYD